MYCLFALVRKVLMLVDANLKLVEGSTNFLLVGLDSIGVVFTVLQVAWNASAREASLVSLTSTDSLISFTLDMACSLSNPVLYSVTAAPVKRSFQFHLIDRQRQYIRR